MERLPPRIAHRPNRHDQRVNQHIFAGNAVIHRSMDDFLGHLKAHIGVFGDACLVVGDADDGTAILFDQRQNHLQPLIFPSHRIEQRLALIRLQPPLESFDNGRVYAQGHIHQPLDHFNHVVHDLGFVGQRNARVHIEQMCPSGHLGEGILFHAAKVALGHFGRQQLAPRRVNALTDNHKRVVWPNTDRAGLGGDDGLKHRRSRS